MGTTVILGIDHPMMQGPNGPYPAEHLEQTETRIEMRDGFDNPEIVTSAISTHNDRVLSGINAQLDDSHRRYVIGIREIDQLLETHNQGVAPKWVISDDEKFQEALAEYYHCDVGQQVMLLTNGGRDAIHAQAFSTSTQPTTFNYIALTASTTAPAATDTSLAGEITTSGGGLVRAQATYAHTTGTNTTTLTHTFTANGTDSLPVTIAQIGVFNASTSGTLCFHTALSGTATLSVIGDNVTVTETITAG